MEAICQNVVLISEIMFLVIILGLQIQIRQANTLMKKLESRVADPYANASNPAA